jgi:hypothetical protein
MLSVLRPIESREIEHKDDGRSVRASRASTADAGNLRTLRRLVLGLFQALRFKAVRKRRPRNRPCLQEVELMYCGNELIEVA